MAYFFNFDKLSYIKGKRPEGCTLCLIRDDDQQVVNMTVCRAELVSVILNLYPYNPGHLLITPLRHVLDIRELNAEERKAMDDTLDKALAVLDRLYKPEAYNIGFNMGRTAGASLEHLHMHVIPRYPREVGIVELIAGERVLVEDPKVTLQKLREAFGFTTETSRESGPASS